MRKSTIAIAFFIALFTIPAIGTVQTHKVAADDFSALLADLSFGDEPMLTEPPAALARAPQVALQYPVSVDESPVAEKIDLDAAFAIAEPNSVPAQPAGHLLHHDHQGGCDSGCEAGCDSGCGCKDSGSEEYCTPHVPVQLPTSSFYQYFRSNKCNSTVWDGYRQPCRSANAHVSGTCDCFDDDKGCGQCGEIVECTDCLQRPRRKLLQHKKSCDDCTGHAIRCDG